MKVTAGRAAVCHLTVVGDIQGGDRGNSGEDFLDHSSSCRLQLSAHTHTHTHTHKHKHTDRKTQHEHKHKSESFLV